MNYLSNNHQIRILCLLTGLLFSIFLAAQVDTTQVKQLRRAAERTFRDGDFERNIRITDSLCLLYAEAGDSTGYAIFSMFNGWTLISQLKDNQRAGYYAHRALQTVEDHLDGKLPYLDDLYALLAAIYENTGNSEKALEYNYLTIKVVAEMGKSNTFADYVAHSNLGATLLGLQRWEEALLQLKKARAIIEGVAQKEGWNPRLYIFAAQLQAHLSNCYIGLKDYPRALEEALAGLPYTEKGDRPDHFRYYEIYLALAEAHSLNGDLEEANRFFDRSEKIYLEFFGPKSSYMANLYSLRAAQAIRQTAFEEALILNTQALEAIGIEVEPATLQIRRDTDQVVCLTCEAGLYRQRADLLDILSRKSPTPQLFWKAGVSNTLAALESLQELNKTILFREGSKQALFEQSQATLKKGCLAAQSLLDQTQDSTYLAQAFMLAEHSKAGRLLEALLRTKAERYAGIPSDILAEERRLGLEWVRQQKLLLDARNQQDSLSAAQIQSSGLFASKRAYEAFLQQIRKNYPQYFEARHQESVVALADVQKMLKEKEILLSYVAHSEDDRLQIFVVTKDQSRLLTVPWPDAYRTELSAFCHALSQRSLIQSSKRKNFITQSRKWYQLLLGPFTEMLKDKERLIILPDDILHYLPFEVLLTETKETDFSQLPFLIMEKAISYHYSATIFLERNPVDKTFSNELLAFAPVFQNGSSGSGIERSHGGLLAPDFRFIEDDHFTPLPWSEEEVKSITALFKSGSAHLLLKDSARESTLKQLLSEGARFIHLASHSFANLQEPAFSGIACASEDGSEDGILYAGEIYQEAVAADLVVLSSCESGIGALTAGEGLLGLNRSFFYAGVPNVLFSLWKVDDQRSSELMIAFYRNVLSGDPYPQALRKAKLELLQQSQSALPFYWAGFNLIGR